MGVTSRGPERPLTFNVDGEIELYQVGRHEFVVISGAGARVKMPNADRRYSELPVSLINGTDGFCSVECAGWFGGNGGVALGPRETRRVRPVRVGGLWYWACEGTVGGGGLVSYTPTLTFTGGPPTVVKQGLYRLSHGGCWFSVSFTSTDGAAASALTITPPVVAPDVDMQIPLSCQVSVDGVYSNPIAYLDCESAAGADRLVKFHGFPTLTDDKAVTLTVSGWYPLDTGQTFTPVATWGTKTATGTAALAGVVRRFSDRGTWWAGDVSYTDSDAADGFGLALPLSSKTPDIDALISHAGHARRNSSAAYRDILSMLDATQATAENRKVAAYGWTAPTDNEIIRCSVAGVYPSASWTAFDADATWTGTAPSGATAGAPIAFYDVSEGLCSFLVYVTSADGNGATGVTFRPPVAPAYSAYPYAVNAVELVNATYSNACGQVSASADATDGRRITLSNLSTATDGQAFALAVAGVYPVVA